MTFSLLWISASAARGTSIQPCSSDLRRRLPRVQSADSYKSHNSEVSPARRFFPLCAPISKYWQFDAAVSDICGASRGRLLGEDSSVPEVVVSKETARTGSAPRASASSAFGIRDVSAGGGVDGWAAFVSPAAAGTLAASDCSGPCVSPAAAGTLRAPGCSAPCVSPAAAGVPNGFRENCPASRVPPAAAGTLGAADGSVPCGSPAAAAVLNVLDGSAPCASLAAAGVPNDRRDFCTAACVPPNTEGILRAPDGLAPCVSP